MTSIESRTVIVRAPHPLGAHRATVRALHAAHRRLVFSLLGHALRLGELRPPEPADH
ncbi:hypothetical protein [Streptomyces sp. RLB3-17]|uniref:hypothetical protein n=1 Tax=Streptomyces sp. RLB3-17 TaxID=2594455 RepID=UPI0013DFBB55|nr:hypothetical protein [Streptomyces sp. RLB3-17]